MVGEPNSIDLKEFILRILEEQNRSNHMLQDARERAIVMAAETLKGRLEAMEKADFVRQTQFNVALDRVRALEESAANASGKLYAFGIMAVILSAAITLALRLVGH